VKESDVEIDIPEVKAEVEAAFAGYEAALVANDVEALDGFFRADARTVRFGGGENLYGIEEIRAFRKGRSPAGLARTLERTVITTFGRDFAVASTMFRRESDGGRVGRQQQTWVRFPEGWRVVAAHVSALPAGIP
jgi:ketosteroid isomerase-like protein